MDFMLKQGEEIFIYCCDKENEAVKLAAANLRTDLYKTMDVQAQISSQHEDACKSRILIETAGVSGEIGRYIDLDIFLDEKGVLRKEAYLLKVTGERLIIAGSDRRGTIYGIYELCGMLGICPWYYWADVPVKRRKKFALPENFTKLDYPSIEYRGVFINDEEELDNWARLHMDEPTIGLNTYEKIFELLLRLKGNYIWPAMHVNSFNQNPANGALAERMGVVVGTSHCDMLMRSNNREWKPWLERKGYAAQYDYSIEGRNREILKEYWRESVEQNKDFEVGYTLGMRGIHDSGLEARDLADGNVTQEKIKLLQRIIDTQQDIISDTLGNSDVLKTFVPYKEVLELYDNGLKVPEDLTLIWSNDNYGYVRRYPSARERLRKGGNGIYYHNSYWSPPGMSYLFISSFPLAQTRYELQKCYDEGIRKLWVLNIGALKPLEQEMEFFLRFAWEVGKPNSLTGDAEEYLASWINSNFSGNHGQETARLLNDYAQLTNTCKIELLDYDAFSQNAYGDEAGARINQFRLLFDRGNTIYYALPKEERAAFFQLVLMKIHAAYFTNCMYYYADRSTLCVGQGKMPAAAEYCRLCPEYDDLRRKLLHYYNKIMSGGKWNGILTPEDFPPPRTAMHPACTPPLEIGGRRMIVKLFNDNDSLTFVRPAEKWLEIANAGEGSFDYGIEAPDWVQLSSYRGTVSTEARIMVGVADTEMPRGGTITVKNISDGIEYSFLVNVASAMPDCANIEDEGVISVEAASGNSSGWREIKRLGRHHGSLMEANSFGATLSFKVYFNQGGEYQLELHRYPSLNSIGRIRVAIEVGGVAAGVMESEVTDEQQGTWRDNVLNNVDKLYLNLPFLSAGLHTITFSAIDKYFAFSRFVIYTKPRRENSLGLGAHYGNQELPRPLDCNGFARSFYGDFTLNPRPVYITAPIYEQDSVTVTDTLLHNPQRGKMITPAEIIASGNSVFTEEEGSISIDAAAALAQSHYAYTHGELWRYCNSESHSGSGLAMYIRQRGLNWENCTDAPSLNYRIDTVGGAYYLWVLLRINARDGSYISAGIDGEILPKAQLYNGGSLWRYEAEQIWRWVPLAELRLEAGQHTLSLYVHSFDLRVDRILLTRRSIAEFFESDML